MAAADGAFDSIGEGLVASIAGLEPGEHALGFRARDAAGNWSPAAMLTISIPAPPAVAPAGSAPRPHRAVGHDAGARTDLACARGA